MSQADTSTNTATSRVQLKRYAHGKYYLYANASEEHCNIVAQALKRAAKVRVDFIGDAFCKALRLAGFPESTVQEYLESVEVIDDVFGSDKITW
ncbi:MAG: hypothetical protein ACYC9P_05565 [Rudaea sp.]